MKCAFLIFDASERKRERKKMRKIAWMWLTVLLLEWHTIDVGSISCVWHKQSLWNALLFHKGRCKSSHRLNFVLALRHFVYVPRKNEPSLVCIHLGSIWLEERESCHYSLRWVSSLFKTSLLHHQHDVLFITQCCFLSPKWFRFQTLCSVSISLYTFIPSQSRASSLLHIRWTLFIYFLQFSNNQCKLMTL